MGSFERQMKRNQLRSAYDEFTVQWRNAKKFQEDRKARGEKLDPKEQELGRKPSFGMFAKRMKAMAAMEKIQAQLKAEEKKEEEKKIDLEWKDE